MSSPTPQVFTVIATAENQLMFLPVHALTPEQAGRMAQEFLTQQASENGQAPATVMGAVGEVAMDEYHRQLKDLREDVARRLADSKAG